MGRIASTGWGDRRPGFCHVGMSFKKNRELVDSGQKEHRAT